MLQKIGHPLYSLVRVGSYFHLYSVNLSFNREICPIISVLDYISLDFALSNEILPFFLT